MATIMTDIIWLVTFRSRGVMDRAELIIIGVASGSGDVFFKKAGKLRVLELCFGILGYDIEGKQ
jgi:hypothetical protein